MARFGHGRWRLPLIAAAVSFGLDYTAYAQVNTGTLRSELNRIFQALLRDPANDTLNRRFIEVALRLEDYDAAIGAVERLLFFNQEDPELHLLAGRLYGEIDSLPAARGYYATVLDLSAATPQQRAEAERAIGEIDRATAPSPWAAVFQAGARYQSNANIAPAVLDENQLLPVELEKPDWNWFALGAITHTLPIGVMVMESAVNGYYADQAEIDRLDVGYARIDSGPRLFLGSDYVSVRPYGMGEATYLGGDFFQYSYGGGASARLEASEAFILEPKFEYRRREYRNTSDYDDTAELTGNFYMYAVRGSGNLDAVNWSATFGFDRNDSITPHRSYDRYSGDVSMSIQFAMFGRDGFSITPFASVSKTEYAAIDPDPFIINFFDFVREDFQWSVGNRFEIPVVENAGLAVQVQYTDNDSNYQQFDYVNWQVSGGPIVRF